MQLLIKAISILALSFACSHADAKTMRVAIIDTGINPYLMHTLKLCPNSSIDLTGTNIFDNNGHGSHIASTVAFNAQDADYCLIIIKYYDHGFTSTGITRGIEFAIKQKADMINISAGGESPIEEERQVVAKALKLGIIINAAAGNYGQDLSKDHTFYPASYDKRINVIGNMSLEYTIHDTSNYDSKHDKITCWEIGSQVAEVGRKKYVFMVGTSQSTAVYTGKLIYAKEKNTTSGRCFVGSRTPTFGNGSRARSTVGGHT
jgi:subtilisin family serine protease